jgi:hypothetical protein
MPTLELEPSYPRSSDYCLTSFTEMADVPHRVTPPPTLQSFPPTFRFPDEIFGPHYSPVSSPEPQEPDEVPDWTEALDPINTVMPSLSQISVAESMDSEAICRELIPDSFFDEEDLPTRSLVSQPLEWRESTLNISDLEDLELEPLERSTISIDASQDLFAPPSPSSDVIQPVEYRCVFMEGTPEEVHAVYGSHVGHISIEDSPTAYSSTSPEEGAMTLYGGPIRAYPRRPDVVRHGRLRNPYPIGVDHVTAYSVRRSFPQASPDDFLDLLLSHGRLETEEEWRRAYDRLEAIDESERSLAADIDVILDQVQPGNVSQQEQALLVIRALTTQLRNRPCVAQGLHVFGPTFNPPPSPPRM